MAFFGNFKQSALELKSLRCLCVTAVLIALDLVLKLFVNFSVSEDLKINFAFIAVAAIGMLYGPTVAGAACFITDVLGYILKPSGAFSPMFTLIEIMGGVIYGCFLYKFSPVRLDFSGTREFGASFAKNVQPILRIVLAKLTVIVVCNLIMTPLAITVTKTMEAGVYNADVFWTGLLTRISTRIVKNAIELPIHVFLLLLTLFPIKAAYNAAFKQKKAI